MENNENIKENVETSNRVHMIGTVVGGLIADHGILWGSILQIPRENQKDQWSRRHSAVPDIGSPVRH